MRIKPFCLSFRTPPTIRPQAILIGKMIPEWLRQGLEPVILTYKKAERWDIPAPLYEIEEFKISKFSRKIVPWRVFLRKRYEQKLFKAAAQIIEKHNLNLVFSFSNPQDSNVLGAMLKEKLGIKFISHFSDPWYDSPYQSLSKSSAKRVLKKEEYIIRKSDRVIFVSEQLRNLVMKKYPLEWQKKSVLIPHCFDPSDYPLFEKHDEGKFILSYIGVFYQKRNPEILFEVIKNLVKKEKNLTKMLKLKLVGCVGDYSDYSMEDLKKAIKNYQLKEIVEIIPQVGHRESLKYMKEADCLVVIDADIENSPFFPSKIVEYAPSLVPIIGITPRGSPTADFLTRLDYQSFDYQQINQLADYLRALILRRIKPKINYQYLNQFDVRATTLHLIKIFEEVQRI